MKFIIPFLFLFISCQSQNISGRTMNDKYFSFRKDYIYVDGFGQHRIKCIETSKNEFKMDFITENYIFWFSSEDQHIWLNVKWVKCHSRKPMKFQVKKFKNKMIK